MTVLSWSHVFSMPLSGLVQAESERPFERLAGDCIESIEDFIREDQDEKALARSFLKVDPVTDPILKSIMESNSPGALPAGTSVFLAQSNADTLVRPRITAKYKDRLCAAGARVTVYTLTQSSHMVSGRDSANAAVDWIDALFNGHSAKDHC